MVVVVVVWYRSLYLMPYMSWTPSYEQPYIVFRDCDDIPVVVVLTAVILVVVT